MTIMQICSYSPNYSGAFIASLACLEKKLEEMAHNTIYAFPDTARNMEWCKEIQKRTRVYFLPHKNAVKNIKTYTTLRKIYKENKIGAVHCHFSDYDIPAMLTVPKSAAVFIHFHGMFKESDWNGANILKEIKHAAGGKFYKNAYLIFVLEYYKEIGCRKIFDINRAFSLPNGIVLSNISKAEDSVKKYDFLTFAGEFYRKGGDLIFRVCDKLWNEGYKFKLLLCGGNQGAGWRDVDDFLTLNNMKSDWLERSETVEDVGVLRQASKSFVTASHMESFAYAAGEAAYAGLPVIASDIPGHKWAKEIPAVRFFADGDENELYKCMKKILEDGNDVLTAEQIQLSRRIIENEYSIDVWTDKLLRIYKNGGMNI